MKQAADFKTGYVAVIGRPNGGKSTLINQMLEHKLSIVSAKPQTTRHQILGVLTDADHQIIFIDTPGIHNQRGTALNRQLNQAAMSSVHDVDVLVMVIEAMKWNDEDEKALKAMQHSEAVKVLVVNKIDRVQHKDDLLPFLQRVADKADFAHIHPVSALKNRQVDALLGTLKSLLPVHPPVFAEDQLTDRPTRFFVAEIIREKLMLRLHQELPYSLSVEVEKYSEEGGIVHIHATIWVERANQKRIVIGKGGEALKTVGIQARKDIESLIGGRVNLQLWVKVKSAWTDDIKALEQLGYTDRT